jgi:hypothetical protein
MAWLGNHPTALLIPYLSPKRTGIDKTRHLLPPLLSIPRPFTPKRPPRPIHEIPPHLPLIAPFPLHLTHKRKVQVFRLASVPRPGEHPAFCSGLGRVVGGGGGGGREGRGVVGEGGGRGGEVLFGEEVASGIAVGEEAV